MTYLVHPRPSSLDLNRRIVERLRLIRAARALVALANCSVGMTVEFTTDDGRVIAVPSSPGVRLTCGGAFS